MQDTVYKYENYVYMSFLLKIADVVLAVFFLEKKTKNYTEKRYGLIIVLHLVTVFNMIYALKY